MTDPFQAMRRHADDLSGPHAGYPSRDVRDQDATHRARLRRRRAECLIAAILSATAFAFLYLATLQ